MIWGSCTVLPLSATCCRTSQPSTSTQQSSTFWTVWCVMTLCSSITWQWIIGSCYVVIFPFPSCTCHYILLHTILLPPGINLTPLSTVTSPSANYTLLTLYYLNYRVMKVPWAKAINLRHMAAAPTVPLQPCTSLESLSHPSLQLRSEVDFFVYIYLSSIV